MRALTPKILSGGLLLAGLMLVMSSCVYQPAPYSYDPYYGYPSYYDYAPYYPPYYYGPTIYFGGGWRSWHRGGWSGWHHRY